MIEIRVESSMNTPFLLIAIGLALGVAAIAAVVLAIRVLTLLKALRAETSIAAEREALCTALRGEKVATDQRLAVMQEKLTRLPILEHEKLELADTLNEVREVITALEIDNATAKEALSREETVHAETRERLSESKTLGRELTTQFGAMRDAKSDVEEQLAARMEKAAALERACDDLAARLNESGRLLTAATEQVSQQRVQISSLTQTLSKEREHAAEKLKLLVEAKEEMTREFKLLAEGALQRNSEVFGKQNIEQIDITLKPLREKMADYEKGMQEAQKEGAKERATLAEQIRHLSDTSARMSTETTNLTKALKGEAKTQGAWGEMILGSILERSGLRENEHYTCQQSHTGEDGQRLRSDIVVTLPNGDRMVVDSKVSLTAFEAHISAEDDVAKLAHLKSHVGSLRSHVKGLSAKKYDVAAGSRLEFVIMFVPIEGALAAALLDSPDLTSFAVENNVAIATPTTLMIALRTAASIWKVEQRNQNAAEIAKVAGSLYDKFVGFSDSLMKVGSRLDQARDAYEQARGQLSMGKGNLVSRAETLKALGARTNKSISADLILNESIDAGQAVAAE